MNAPDTAENRLKKTLFVVEATSAEQFMLWKDWSVASDSPRYGKMKWEPINPGWMVTVGKIGKRPCCISISWQRIDGHMVMFWYPCSQVSDSLKSEAWIEANFSGKWDHGHRRAYCDAGNFHLCVNAIREANEGTPL